MKYEEFKKQTSKFVFKDNDSPDWSYNLLDWEKVQLFPVVKFIGIFKVNEAKRFLIELKLTLPVLTGRVFLFYICTAGFDRKCVWKH